jgi:hypothetical protein
VSHDDAQDGASQEHGLGLAQSMAGRVGALVPVLLWRALITVMTRRLTRKSPRSSWTPASQPRPPTDRLPHKPRDSPRCPSAGPWSGPTGG